MDFAQLRDAELGTVNDTADAWSSVSAKLLDVQSHHITLSTSMTNGAWVGDSADMANSQLSLLNEQLNAAKTETKALYDILVDAAEQFTTKQDELKNVIDEIDGIPELAIDDAGIVTLTDQANPDNDPTILQIWQNQQVSYQENINTIVDEATTADENIAEALQLAAETNNDGDVTFNAQAMDMEELAEVREAEADTIALLNADPTQMTPEQLDELNTLLATYGENPVFATEMLEEMGPDEFLNSVAAHSYQGNLYANDPYLDGDVQGYLNLQENLGLTLAAATDPANGEHLDQEWVQGLMNAGTSNISHIPDVEYRGYLALAPLLEHGEYHEDFLTPIANHVMMQANDDAIWAHQGAAFDPNPYAFNPEYVIEGQPADQNPHETRPLNSVYLALENNPDAAAQVFGGDGPPPEFEYKNFDGEDLAPIDNPVDFALSAHHESLYPMDDLDGALEAAATGVTPGDDSPYPLHSQENIATTERLMSYLGDHPTDLAPGGELEGFADNMTTISSNYMVDIHSNLVPEGGAYADDVNLPGEQADFEKGDLTRVLHSLGQHEDSMYELAGANQAATTTLVSAGYEQFEGQPPQTWIEDAAAPGSYVSGILADGQSHYIVESGQESDTSHNDRVDLIAEGASTVAGLKIPGVGMVVDPIAEMFHVDNIEEYSGDAQAANTYLEDTSANNSSTAVEAALIEQGMTPEEAEQWCEENLSGADFNGWFQDGRGYVIDYTD